MTKIIKNSIKCNNCGDVLESKFTHDYQECSCGNVFCDGGKEYIRIGFKPGATYTDLCEYEEDSDET